MPPPWTYQFHGYFWSSDLANCRVSSSPAENPGSAAVFNLIQFPAVLNSMLTTDSHEHDAKRISFSFLLFTSSAFLSS